MPFDFSTAPISIRDPRESAGSTGRHPIVLPASLMLLIARCERAHEDGFGAGEFP